jgi:type III secretion protein W
LRRHVEFSLFTMTTRVDRGPVTGYLDADAGMTRESAGSLSGEQVKVKDAISVLEDAREEISMHHSEKVEAKEFAEREIEGGESTLRIRIEQIEAYLQATHQFRDPRHLADVIRLMQHSRRPRDVARREARTRAGQYALLRLALQDAHKRVLPVEVIEQLEDALEELERESGGEILAGLNTAEVAAEFASSAEGVENFQQAYTDIVLGEGSFAQTLLVVLQRLAGARGEGFQRGLTALLNALGADLKATNSSTDRTRLQALIQDVYQLEVAGSVLEGCTKLSTNIATRFGIDSVDPLALMQELVLLTNERWITPQRLRSLAEKFNIAGLLQRITFHTGTKTVLRRMPVKVFPDADARHSVLGTAQQVLDETVAEEEERLGQ